MTPDLDISELSQTVARDRLSCDVLIIGAGPAGLTVARGLEGSGLDVLILESGARHQSEQAEELNAVLADATTWTDEQVRRRKLYHGSQAELWTHETQQYGVRCRGLGGATAAWAGKSAAFSDIDYAPRPWVANSGWPIRHHDLADHLDRAAKSLNLSVNCYDDDLWALMNRAPPEPRPDPKTLRSFFWQFARSTIDPMDVMRVGAEFAHAPPAGCRVLLGATVTEVLTKESGAQAIGARVTDASGQQHVVVAGTVVLAASAVENARILLNSTAHNPEGLGNAHDVVGRYLMDHPNSVVASFDAPAVTKMVEMFGFYGLKTPQGINMYMRGLTLTDEAQEAEGLLHCAAFMPGERAPDDPWDAAKRILKRQSTSYLADSLSILKSPGLVCKGLGRLALQNRRFPTGLSRFIVNQVVRFRPNMAVEEFMTGGVPHKLTGVSVQVICEQVPDPDNRITLAKRMDRNGVPLPHVNWRLGETELRSISRFATILAEEFERAGLPAPVLASWVRDGDFDAAAIIDMAHSAGTTRMATDPAKGVVDRDCKVHGVEGLYVAGASVFPTSGHANPTLMITALAFRLADHLRQRRADPALGPG